MSCAVIGYTFEADTHCNKCTEERFDDDGHGHFYGEDNEGNLIHPIFDQDEVLETMNCGECGHTIREVALTGEF